MNNNENPNNVLTKSTICMQILAAFVFLLIGVAIAFLPVYFAIWVIEVVDYKKYFAEFLVLIGLPILIFCISWIIIFLKLLCFDVVIINQKNLNLSKIHTEIRLIVMSCLWSIGMFFIIFIQSIPFLLFY